jgi:quinol monooxygenase YgiN
MYRYPIFRLLYNNQQEKMMDTLAILALPKAKPGKEKELEGVLKSALPMVEAEADTTSWYALKLGPDKFGIFDTFPDEFGRNAHLSGEIAKALFAKADELLAEPPTIEQPEILAVKTPEAQGSDLNTLGWLFAAHKEA